MTYAEAVKQATKKNPNVVYRGDAGQGWSFEMYYCPRRKRRVSVSINPHGDRIV